jgi:hypothetical protein
VFSIPVGVVYRPNEAKVRNLQQKDYLGKARLVAASDRSNAFTGFAGVEMQKVVRRDPGLVVLLELSLIINTVGCKRGER